MPGIVLEKKKRRMATRSTREDFTRSTRLVMWYFDSNSERFLCQRSCADLMLGGRERREGGGGEE